MMYRFISVFLLFLTSFSTNLFTSNLSNFKGWTHLELGAGNYGPDGHTKASQTKTVLMKLKEVSNQKHYIDDLEETGSGDYKPEEQYWVLFWTLDQLVNRYGPVGVFHVNDLYEEYAIFATEKLITYAKAKGYDSVIIEAVPGDYELIDSKQTLIKYGKSQYSSLHLKNPEISFYHERMDGDSFFSSESSREQTRSLLKKLAMLSRDGLYLFILFHSDFIPLEESTEFIEKGIFYHKTDAWEALPYIYPEGELIDKKNGRVFHITNL